MCRAEYAAPLVPAGFDGRAAYASVRHVANLEGAQIVGKTGTRRNDRNDVVRHFALPECENRVGLGFSEVSASP